MSHRRLWPPPFLLRRFYVQIVLPLHKLWSILTYCGQYLTLTVCNSCCSSWSYYARDSPVTPSLQINCPATFISLQYYCSPQPQPETRLWPPLSHYTSNKLSYNIHFYINTCMCLLFVFYFYSILYTHCQLEDHLVHNWLNTYCTDSISARSFMTPYWFWVHRHEIGAKW